MAEMRLSYEMCFEFDDDGVLAYRLFFGMNSDTAKASSCQPWTNV